MHTGDSGEYPLGIDVRKNFLAVLSEIQKYQFDLLVLGGDLCLNTGQAAIYEWQKKHLDTLSKPYYIIAGNHDDQALLASTFQLSVAPDTKEIYYQVPGLHEVFLFLDTGRQHTSDTQKEWLIATLKQHAAKQIVVFMHHPPALMNVPFMDNAYALDDRDEILALFLNHGNPVHVFCGHYHVQKSLYIQNVTIHVTPSLYVQINQFEQEFFIDHQMIAYRMISLNQNRLGTSVHYLPGH
jgi:Icc protein